MITREFLKGDAASVAIYSDCEQYRYILTRVWDENGPRLTYVMLNPSTATEVQNDPTIERCERRARALGYGGIKITNIFAWRDTDPKNLKKAKHPVGPENDALVAEAAGWADLTLCGWGAHGDHLGRGAEIAAVLRATGQPLATLGTSKAGHPRHPLYISYQTQPTPWDGVIRPVEDMK